MPAGPQALSRGFRGVIKPAAAPQLHVALPILFDRRQSTRRPLVVISLRDVAAQLQHPPRQLADTGCVFGKAEFTAKFLSIAPPNRHRGQSGSSLCIVGDLDRRRSDRHLQFRGRSVARAKALPVLVARTVPRALGLHPHQLEEPLAPKMGRLSCLEIRNLEVENPTDSWPVVLENQVASPSMVQPAGIK